MPKIDKTWKTPWLKRFEEPHVAPRWTNCGSHAPAANRQFGMYCSQASASFHIPRATQQVRFFVVEEPTEDSAAWDVRYYPVWEAYLYRNPCLEDRAWAFVPTGFKPVVKAALKSGRTQIHVECECLL